MTDDLYSDLGNLALTKEGVLSLANKYGSLHLLARHFHTSSDGSPSEGERWVDWKREVGTFKQIMDLWYWLSDGDSAAVKSFIKSLRKEGPRLVQTPFHWPEKPWKITRTLLNKSLWKRLTTA